MTITEDRINDNANAAALLLLEPLADDDKETGEADIASVMVGLERLTAHVMLAVCLVEGFGPQARDHLLAALEERVRMRLDDIDPLIDELQKSHVGKIFSRKTK